MAIDLELHVTRQKELHEITEEILSIAKNSPLAAMREIIELTRKYPELTNFRCILIGHKVMSHYINRVSMEG
jgi:ribosomal protein L17